MQWDLGWQGLAVLGGMSLAFGVLAGLLVGKSATHRLMAIAIATVACFGVGLVISEMLFGWATEEDLQPNIDGLSRDEVLIAQVLTTAAVVLVMRYLARRPGTHALHRDGHVFGRSHGRHRHA
jgi:hypothetical protein